MNAIVIGASGGIGGALADALAARGDVVTRLSRGSDPTLDFDDEAGIVAAAARLSSDGPYDLVIVATGLLHGEGVAPEKSLRAIDGATLDRYFRVNATGPALVMRHFLPLLARDRRALFVALSARVGSIDDNRIGGWVGYRASKAALNQIVRTVSIELSRTHRDAIIVGLHPGTVDTPLSAPFQRGLADGQLTTPARSAARLIAVLDGLGTADSGGCFDWAGARIPA